MFFLWLIIHVFTKEYSQKVLLYFFFDMCYEQAFQELFRTITQLLHEPKPRRNEKSTLVTDRPAAFYIAILGYYVPRQ